MKRHLSLALMAVLCLLLAACSMSTKPKTLPPGAINSFDAESYLSLMGAQAVLNSVKADIAKLPPEAKPALNTAIQSYNVAEAAWQAYHAGKTNDPAALTAALTRAVTDATTLLTRFTGGKR